MEAGTDGITSVQETIEACQREKAQHKVLHVICLLKSSMYLQSKGTADHYSVYCISTYSIWI